MAIQSAVASSEAKDDGLLMSWQLGECVLVWVAVTFNDLYLGGMMQRRQDLLGFIFSDSSTDGLDM